MLLPREHLPLACLDLVSPDHDMPVSRLYESHIKILDLESRVDAAPSLLIARHDPNGTLYAVESHAAGRYVVCKLGPWTDLEALAANATAISRDRLRPARPETRPQPPAPAPAPSAATPQLYGKDQRKKRAAIEAIQSLMRKRPRSRSMSVFDDAAGRPAAAAETAHARARLPSPNIKTEELPSPEIGRAHV